MSDLARDCASLFEALLEDKGQRIPVGASGEDFVSGDCLLLRQAFPHCSHIVIEVSLDE
jgi:hypothetical protein